MNFPEKIQDTLVSVAVILDAEHAPSFDQLVDLAKQAAAAYQFVDFLIVADARSEIDAKEFERVIAYCPQSRCLQLDGANGYDELLKFACREVIGDFVVFTSADEIGKVDLLHVLTELRDGLHLVRMRRTQAPVMELAAARAVKLVTGFDVDPRFLRTIGVNRSLLGEFLNHPSLLSFIRFRAKTSEAHQRIITVDVTQPRSGVRALLGRIEVVANLVGMAAPRLLSFAAALSALLAFLSLGYMVYVGLVLLLKSHVAEGWTTLSLVIAFGLFVQTTALAIICLGVARLFRNNESQTAGRILNDLSSSDLFRSFSALNVKQS